jgi:ABC-2 type transport system permease protein
VTAPPIIFLILACILASAVVGDPCGATSTILSLLPPFAPVLMPFRMATGTVPGGEVLLAAVLVRATALALTWVAGRIYANPVWRIGARVRLLDALRRR